MGERAISECSVCGTANRWDEIRRTYDCHALNHGLQRPATLPCGAEGPGELRGNLDCGCGWGYLCPFTPDGTAKCWEVRCHVEGDDRVSRHFVAKLEDRMRLEDALLDEAYGRGVTLTILCDGRYSGSRVR
jgi:hypothetical protein